MPQRGKLRVKLCVRAECSPLSRPSRNGELAEIASSSGSTGRRRSHDAHGAVDVADADVHVQAERVVAPRDVFQALLDAAVVLGVDDRLLAVVGPRMRAGRAQRGAVRVREARTGPGGARAVARARRAGRAPAPEMISISEEISSPVMCSCSTRSTSAAAAQLLEARGQFERLRVEDRELLLDADGEVGRGSERLGCSI